MSLNVHTLNSSRVTCTHGARVERKVKEKSQVGEREEERESECNRGQV